MIQQKILILKQPVELGVHNLKFPKGTEFEIVANVVYVGGFPIQQELQPILLKWLTENMVNKSIFHEDLRRFK